jgi:hypothetical protein
MISGDILSRTNLFRWIREFVRSSSIPPGIIMEFGVLNGESLIEAYRQLRGHVTHVYGFDSFDGIPELSPGDEDGQHLMAVFHTGNYTGLSAEEVRNIVLSSCQIPPEKLSIVPGDFRKSLPAFDKSRLAGQGALICIHIDCDVYSATKAALEFAENEIVDGTWILLDDYWCYRGNPKYGERKAFEEWAANNKRVGVTAYTNYRGYGRAYIAYLK